MLLNTLRLSFEKFSPPSFRAERSVAWNIAAKGADGGKLHIYKCVSH